MSEQRTGRAGVPSPTEMNDASTTLAPTTPTSTTGTSTATQVLDRTEEAASDVAAQLSEGAGQVKDVVADRVHEVAGEAKQEAKHLVEEVKGRVVAEADSSATQLGQVLRDTGFQLSSMAARANEDGLASDLVRELGGRAQELGERIQRDGIRGVTEDLTRWARRNPGAFLVAAGATGFVVGRLFRNVNTSKIADAAKGDGNGASGRSGPTANQLFAPATEPFGLAPSAIDLTDVGAAPVANATEQGTVPGTRP